jgi:protoporphyrinogen oxidase
MARLVVIGAGPMGLAAAHRAAILGHSVSLLEADNVVGGMAAHFDFGGLSIERFYHFVCKSDEPTFQLMEELGIASEMRWKPTSMGYYMGGMIHPWGDPISLLRFPHLSLLSKVRTGLQMFLATRASNFDAIEHMTARQWLEAGSGTEVYRKLWKRLLGLKFYEMADEVSASWIATRVRRVGTSRRSIFQEELGYIEGGSQILVEALESAFKIAGGTLHLSTPAQVVETANGKVEGVVAGGKSYPADAVISTVPTPLVKRLVPNLSPRSKALYDGIRNIGVVCLIFKLRKSVSRHFWLNIVDDSIEIPGLIEFSNLRPTQDTIVYVPYYMPTSHPKWKWTDTQFMDEAFGYIRRINPQITNADLIEAKVGRLTHAQPICEPNFHAKLPPVQTPIKGLQIADTCFYYPEDRGISESIRFGRMMAESV